MSKKTQARQLALQLLFLFDAHSGIDEQMASTAAHDASDDPVTRITATDMAKGAWNSRETIDAWVERLAPQWPPRRQPGVDRASPRVRARWATQS